MSQSSETLTAIQNAHLKEMHELCKRATAETHELFSGKSEEQLQWKSAPATWNILECIAHINRASELYHPRIKQAIETAREKDLRNDAPFKPSWFGKMFIGMIVPESKRRIKTTSIFKPKEIHYDSSVKDQLLAFVAEMKQFTQDADGYELNTRMIYSPATRLIRFSIGEAIWLMTVHNLRHIQQARNLSLLDDFPAA